MSYDPNDPWKRENPDPNQPNPNNNWQPGYGGPQGYGGSQGYGAPPPNYPQYPPQGGYPPYQYPGMRSPEQQKVYNMAIAGIIIALCSFCFFYFLGIVSIILGGIAISKHENKGWIAVILGGVSILFDIISIAIFGF